MLNKMKNFDMPIKRKEKRREKKMMMQSKGYIVTGYPTIWKRNYAANSYFLTV